MLTSGPYAVAAGCSLFNVSLTRVSFQWVWRFSLWNRSEATHPCIRFFTPPCPQCITLSRQTLALGCAARATVPYAPRFVVSSFLCCRPYPHRAALLHRASSSMCCSPRSNPEPSKYHTQHTTTRHPCCAPPQPRRRVDDVCIALHLHVLRHLLSLATPTCVRVVTIRTPTSQFQCSIASFLSICTARTTTPHTTLCTTPLHFASHGSALYTLAPTRRTHHTRRARLTRPRRHGR